MHLRKIIRAILGKIIEWAVMCLIMRPISAFTVWCILSQGGTWIA